MPLIPVLTFLDTDAGRSLSWRPTWLGVWGFSRREGGTCQATGLSGRSLAICSEPHRGVEPTPFFPHILFFLAPNVSSCFVPGLYVAFLKAQRIVGKTGEHALEEGIKPVDRSRD